jgi:hypothetical protein
MELLNSHHLENLKSYTTISVFVALKSDVTTGGSERFRVDAAPIFFPEDY